MTHADTGIVIVTFNSGDHIGPCLDAAIPTGADIVVVDNASQDGTADLVRLRPDVRLVRNSTNRGFAAAANQGFAVMNRTYVLLLNPDTEILSGLEAMRDACSLPGGAASGGQLLDFAGKPQIGFMVRDLPRPSVFVLEALMLNRLWPGNPVNRRYRQLDFDYSRMAPVGQPAGAFLMVRKAVWEDLGGFDEGFFPLWFEDVDFCKRIVDRGERLYYVPQATARHAGGHSISQLSVEKRRIYWYRSLLRYSSKHFHPAAFRGVCLAVIAGALLRSMGEAVWQRSLNPLAAYRKVVWHAGRCLIFGWGDRVVSSGSR